MSLLNRLERLLGRYAIENLTLWLVLGQVLVLGLALVGHFDVERILLVPAYVKSGEVWRLFTFLFMPPVSGALSMTSALFLAFGWYLYYLMGSALERNWGAFRYNLFFLLGWLLTAAVAFVTPNEVTDYDFLAVSVFLAFAFLNPDFVLYIFFILPVKIKWLALLIWIGFAYKLLQGDLVVKMSVLAATGNFLVFFGRDIVQLVRTGRRRMVHQARQFGAQNDDEEPRHRCHACGKTDLTHPQMEFRYCSKCAGEECYCAEHIGNHVHTTVANVKR